MILGFIDKQTQCAATNPFVAWDLMHIESRDHGKLNEVNIS